MKMYVNMLMKLSWPETIINDFQFNVKRNDHMLLFSCAKNR